MNTYIPSQIDVLKDESRFSTSIDYRYELDLFDEMLIIDQTTEDSHQWKINEDEWVPDR